MSNISSSYTTPSGMTGAGGGNLLRVTGMASGLDVDAMVKKMMAAEQAKLDKAMQDQQTIQWKQDAYQGIIKDIKDLQSSFFDSASSSKNILSSTNYSPFTVNGVGTATVDTSVATFTPGVGAQMGNYSITFGTDGQLASAATKTGSKIVLDTSSGFTEANWDGKNIGFSINGGSDQIINLSSLTAPNNTITDTVNDINAKINANSSLKGNVQAVVNGGMVQFQALSDSSVKISNTSTTVASDIDTLKGVVINPSTATAIGDLSLGSSGGTIAFKYNGTSYSVTVNSTDKISDVINNISNQTSGLVTANFSQLTGSFTLQSSSTGSSQSLQITTGLSALGITTDGTAIVGKDAIVYITPPGGTSTKVIKSTNNFTLDGMNYYLSNKGDATVSVGSDTQSVYDKIQGFIDKYNTIVDEIQTKLTEKKDSNYKPLTDAQKASMSASQITAWETKAKVGILRNDNNLQNILNDLRTAFTTAVSNTGLSFGKYGSNSFGIDTSSDYSKPAHIDIVDASKLKAAIANKSDQVLKIFTNVATVTTTDTSTYSSSSPNYNADGIFTRINKILQNNVGFTNTTLNTATLTSYANQQYDFSNMGSGGQGTIPDQLYEQQLMIKKITDDMSTKQEKYYQQFSQLETAMNQLNSQQSALTSMLGG